MVAKTKAEQRGDLMKRAVVAVERLKVKLWHAEPRLVVDPKVEGKLALWLVTGATELPEELLEDD